MLFEHSPGRDDDEVLGPFSDELFVKLWKVELSACLNPPLLGVGDNVSSCVLKVHSCFEDIKGYLLEGFYQIRFRLWQCTFLVKQTLGELGQAGRSKQSVVPVKDNAGLRAAKDLVEVDVVALLFRAEFHRLIRRLLRQNRPISAQNFSQKFLTQLHFSVRVHVQLVLMVLRLLHLIVIPQGSHFFVNLLSDVSCKSILFPQVGHLVHTVVSPHSVDLFIFVFIKFGVFNH